MKRSLSFVGPAHPSIGNPRNTKKIYRLGEIWVFTNYHGNSDMIVALWSNQFQSYHGGMNGPLLSGQIYRYPYLLGGTNLEIDISHFVFAFLCCRVGFRFPFFERIQQCLEHTYSIFPCITNVATCVAPVGNRSYDVEHFLTRTWSVAKIAQKHERHARW